MHRGDVGHGREALGDEPVVRVHVGDLHFHQVIKIPCEVVAGADFAVPADFPFEFFQQLPFMELQRDVAVSANLFAQLLAVKPHGVAGDDTLVFQALDPGEHRAPAQARELAEVLHA